LPLRDRRRGSLCGVGLSGESVRGVVRGGCREIRAEMRNQAGTQEIVDELQTAMDQFAVIASELKK